MTDAGLISNGTGGFRVIPGQHDHPDPLRLQLCHGICGILPDHIRDCDDSKQPAVLRKVQRRFSCLRQGFSLSDPGLGEGETFSHVGKASAHHQSTVHLRRYAVPRKCAKLLYLRGTLNRRGCILTCSGMLNAVVRWRAGMSGVFRAMQIFHYRPGQGMLASFLQMSCLLQQILFRHIFCRKQIRYGRSSLGDGSCLIQNHDIHLSGLFQSFAGFEQDPGSGPDTVSDHDGHGRCKSQRTGT